MFSFPCSSGRFQKVSGRLAGRLPEVKNEHFHLPAVPEGSGRFPEDLPEACSWGISFPAVPEGSGWLPEVVPEAFSACVHVHTFKTCCNLERKLMSLWTLDAVLGAPICTS